MNAPARSAARRPGADRLNTIRHPVIMVGADDRVTANAEAEDFSVRVPPS